MNSDLDIESAVSKLEQLVPKHLLSEIEMIIFGQFEEFEEKEINAFYRDGTLNISSYVDSEDEVLSHMIHETAHSVEEAYSREIYFDQKLKSEFLRKRVAMYDVLWKMGFKAPKSMFLDAEYSHEFDMYLLKEIGYDKLSQIVMGMFISPYSATSLREYFATGFVDYFTHPNDHGYLKRTSPQLFNKLQTIYNEENLDF